MTDTVFKWPRLGRMISALSLAAAIVLTTAAPSSAQSLLRDTEIEEIMQEFTTPLLQAAGLSAESVDLYLVNDPSLNAFVTRGQNIFLHSGLILEARTPNQLKGVIGHEAGHIASGHLARSDYSQRSAYGSMLIAMGLGLAAILAGEGQAGAAILGGSQQFAVIDVLAHSRINEAAADQAAAKYLRATGQSSEGLVEFFERFRAQEVLSNARRYPYFRGHPLSSERIDSLREISAESPYHDVEDSDEDKKALKMTQAKLRGFLEAPQTVFSYFPESDESDMGYYARSVAHYRAGDLKSAIKEIEVLIAREPDNPYFHELKGQIYYESGRGELAIPSIEEAVRLKPDAPLLKIALAAALIEQGNVDQIDTAEDLLKLALRDEKENGFAWYQLSQVYDRQGNPGLAKYAVAEQAFSSGQLERAMSFAGRAQQELPRGTAAWRRASDILAVSEAQLRNRKRR